MSRRCVLRASLWKVCPIWTLVVRDPHFALVQWNDIDLYHAYRDFTTDPVSFHGDELRAFIQKLVSISPR
jgi:hypothetical protein